MNKTIIYYTSNREKPEFEQKIIDNLVKQAGNIPIISVSQKPMKLGKNICVGANVGLSYLNEWRQILIGAKEAKTPYLIFAESDFLYPKDYFTFEPAGGNLYRYNNVWIVFKDKLYSYRRKPYSEGAQICSREFIIEKLEEHLEGQPEWFDGRIIIRDKRGRRRMNLRRMPFEFFGGKNPCISFKTGDGVRPHTSVLKGRENIKTSLPYWGHIKKLRKKYL